MGWKLAYRPADGQAGIYGGETSLPVFEASSGITSDKHAAVFANLYDFWLSGQWRDCGNGWRAIEIREK